MSPAMNGAAMSLGEQGSHTGEALARLFQCLVENWEIVEEDTISLKDRGVRRVFALMKQKTSKPKGQAADKSNTSPQRFTKGDHYNVNYEQKYPADAYNEAMSPNARIWRVFLDEAGSFDLDMVENIRDTVDVILVFAGLFSAIVSTLVSQTSMALQPDYGHITAGLLNELVEVQRAIASNGSLDGVFRSSLNLTSSSTTTSPDRWVNGMWFVSLAFSLSTALLAVLVKQWIQAYISPISGTPQHQGRIRHFRYMGIEKWHVPLIVGLLPILLHLALFLFFIGLIVLLFTLDIAIAIVVAFIAILAYAGYVAANLLPIWYPECPYKTPISTYIYIAVRAASPGAREIYHRVKAFFAPIVNAAITIQRDVILTDEADSHIEAGCFTTSSDFSHSTAVIPETRTSENFQQLEADAVSLHGDDIDAHMLNWVCKVSANPSLITVVCTAINDLRIGYPNSAMEILQAGVLKHICAALKEGTQAFIIPFPGLAHMDARKLRQGLEGTMLIRASAHLRLIPPASSTNVFNHCDCDWTLSGERLEVGDLEANLVYMPVSLARFAIRIEHIPAYQPPVLSQYSWISLLVQAIDDTRMHTRRDLPQRRASLPCPLLDAAWDSFTSLWIISHRDSRRIHQASLGSTPDPPSDIFSLLQGILLAAYLCHWSSGLTSLIIKQGNVPYSYRARVDDHPLLYRATQTGQHQDLAQELSRPKATCMSKSLGRQFTELQLYYDTRTIIHLLKYLIDTTPNDVDALSHVVNQLFPLRSCLFDSLLQHPPEYLSESTLSGSSEASTTPIYYLIVGRLAVLLPTPSTITSILRRSDTLTSPIERITFILRLCAFLLQLNHHQVLETFKRYDVLQALDKVLVHVLSLPDEAREYRNEVSMLVRGVLNAYYNKCHEASTAVDYLFSHLTMLCAFSAMNNSGTVGVLAGSVCHGLIRLRPLEPAWDRAVEDIQKMPWAEDQRPGLHLFLRNLCVELERQRRLSRRDCTRTFANADVDR